MRYKRKSDTIFHNDPALKEKVMSFWQILGNLAAFDKGKLIQRVSENTSISSDGSTRMVGGATGIGAVFNFSKNSWCINLAKSIC